MTVAHDAATKTGTGWTTTPDPFTFDHTPVGTPRGVVVILMQNGSTSDLITSITYGGVTMTRIIVATDTATETGAAYAYFLGESIPTGTQTVSIDHTATAVGKIAVCYTVTAGGDTRVLVSGAISQNATDPQITLDTGGTPALRYFGLHSGLPNVSDLTLVADMTAVDSNDPGDLIQRWDRETVVSSGATVVGYTAATDDVAMVAVAVEEIGTHTTIVHDTASESHTGSSGQNGGSPNPFTWTHTPINTPKGVLVFCYVDRAASSFTGVTYGGVSLGAVTGGEANDTAGGVSTTHTFFLGSGIPTGAQTVAVSHTGATGIRYAICITVTGTGDTEVVGTPVLLEETGILAEQAVDSGSVIAVRYCGLYSGLIAVPSPGASSVALHSIDFGSVVAASVREQTPGAGSRSVGFSSGTSDDRAGVHLAIAEISTYTNLVKFDLADGVDPGFDYDHVLRVRARKRLATDSGTIRIRLVASGDVIKTLEEPL